MTLAGVLTYINRHGVWKRNVRSWLPQQRLIARTKPKQQHAYMDQESIGAGGHTRQSVRQMERHAPCSGAHREARLMFVRTAHMKRYGSAESSRTGHGTPANKAFELTAVRRERGVNVGVIHGWS